MNEKKNAMTTNQECCEKIKCEHDFSVVVKTQRSMFASVVTHVACRKCAETRATGKLLFEET